MKVIKALRLLLCNLIVLHLFTKTSCGNVCGNRCCLNFYLSPDGDCLECPLGTHGSNCTEQCVKGWYGRLCRSKCDCPAERCDTIYGCQETTTEKDTESICEWVNVMYALIGSVTTMSLIGLLFYLKSWFSKTKSPSTSAELPSTATDQVYTVNQIEHEYEHRRNPSSTETETVV